MNVHVKHQDAVAVVSLEGNLFAGSNATPFCNVLSDLLRSSTYRVVLDFSGVTWVSIGGTGLLISALASFQNHRGDIKLAGVSEDVQDALTKASFDRFFSLYETPAAAIADF